MQEGLPDQSCDLKPGHCDPKGREPVNHHPDLGPPWHSDFPPVPPNQKLEGKEPTDVAHVGQLPRSGGAKT